MKAWIRQKARDVETKGAKKASWFVFWKEPNGRQRSRSCGTGARGKQLANNLAAELNVQLVSGNYTADPSLKLWAAFIREFRQVELRKKSEVHATEIEKTIARFEEVAKPETMAGIDTRCIDKFVMKRSQERGRKKGSKLSPATVNKDLRNLKLILSVAKDWKQIPEVPRIKELKVPGRIKRFVTAEHLSEMFQAAGVLTRPILPNVEPRDYWKALLGLAFCTGWRISEVQAIHRNDVDFDSSMIKSRWCDTKGKRDELIYVPESVSNLLRPVWLNFSEQPLLYPTTSRTMQEQFVKLQLAAGIRMTCEDDHEHTDNCFAYGFHDLRRSFATYNASRLSAAELQQLMKHSDGKTTQGYINYGKLMSDRPEVFIPDAIG